MTQRCVVHGAVQYLSNQLQRIAHLECTNLVKYMFEPMFSNVNDYNIPLVDQRPEWVSFVAMEAEL